MNPRYNLIYVVGPTPGPVHSYCLIHDTWLLPHRRRMLTEGNTPPMPTWQPDVDSEGLIYPYGDSRNIPLCNENDFAEDVYHDSILPYSSSLITYN
ncbi:unnamed protein product [Protopolystoma xenopodis]|uniref:Uncharacterized protein n=1 Tax=Protopolystoma xenopodis TaxID=117903 RepID=A0A3S5ARS0_9PLAT|nr:unnamed protein product [Protopolystoma xenopodis]